MGAARLVYDLFANHDGLDTVTRLPQHVPTMQDQLEPKNVDQQGAGWA